MQVDHIELRAEVPGQHAQLTVLRFGHPGTRPKATILAALHADEVPAMLVAQHLRTQLAALEAAGQLRGEVLLLPMANPLGLAQQLLGQVQGRFDLHDGLNFNRGHADLSEAAAAIAGPALGADLAHNRSQVRAALRQAAAALVEFLRRRGIVEGRRCRCRPRAAGRRRWRPLSLSPRRMPASSSTTACRAIGSKPAARSPT